MSLLTDIFSIPTATAKGLYKYGIASYSMERKYEIYQHYSSLLEDGIKSYCAAIDCSIHLNVSVRYVWVAVKEIEEIKKAVQDEQPLTV